MFQWHDFKKDKPQLVEGEDESYYCSNLLMFCINNHRLFLGYYLKEKLNDEYQYSIEVPIFNHCLFTTLDDELEADGCLYEDHFDNYDIKWCEINAEQLIKEEKEI